jgi:type III secretory pathway lipoprotein EscJ
MNARRQMVLAATMILFCGLCAACEERLALLSSQQEANEIAVILEARGIQCSVEQSRSNAAFELRVAAHELNRARQVLVQHRLPRTQMRNSKSSLFGPSLLEARALARQQQADALSRSLRLLDGVRDARLHLAEQEPSARRDSRLAASLLLLVSFEDPERLEALRQKASRLLNGGIDGLATDDLEIVLEPAPALTNNELDWDWIGPWQVQREHASSLRFALLALLSTLLLSAAAIATLLLRARRNAKKLPSQSE